MRRDSPSARPSRLVSSRLTKGVVTATRKSGRSTVRPPAKPITPCVLAVPTVTTRALVSQLSSPVVLRMTPVAWSQ